MQNKSEENERNPELKFYDIQKFNAIANKN